ncbi:MAG TPA: DHA2 family efflux MFS transporter permease subunit [Patescibacteria group bacterium]|nr:DHA2 family efflux MFS transporter permease subunit [Patescibacteria group bacterium]
MCDERDDRQAAGHYIILANICIGTVLTSYVSSCINIALPNMMQSLNFNLDSIVWVSLSYLLPYGGILPLTGNLGDQYGTRPLYIAGFLVFTVATLLCGLAPNATLLVMFRILQGVGAAMLLPNAMAIVAATFPVRNWSKALGIWSAMSALGTACGPVIGGYIIEMFSWRALFFSVLPIAAMGILISLFVLPKTTPGGRKATDYPGAALLLAGISCLLLALNQGQREGWTSVYILSLATVSGCCLLVFPWWEAVTRRPLIDMALFRSRNFMIANLAGFVSILVMYAAIFLLPFFLKTILGYDSIRAGQTMLPLSATMLFAAPAGGWLVSRFGVRWPATVGMLLVASAMLLFATLDPAYGPSHFYLRLLLLGVGLGLSMSPLTSCAMDTVNRQQAGVASGVLNLFRLTGGGVGVVLASILLYQRTMYHGEVLNEVLRPVLTASREVMALIQKLWGARGLDAAGVAVAAQGIFTGAGLSHHDYGRLKLVLAKLVHQQASIQAFQDVFLVMGCLCLMGVLFTVWIRSSGEKRSRQ